MPDRSSKPKKPQGPKDANQLAYGILGALTGGVALPDEPAKNPAAVALGKLGGAKGGPARAAALSPAKKKKIAKKAAAARWKKEA